MAVNNLNTPGVGIQPSIVDAKGDLIAGTAADAVGRLGVGTNGHVLVADSGETTGLKWNDPGTVGGLVHIQTTSVSGASSHSFGSDANPIFSSTFNNYKILITDASAVNRAGLSFRLRANTTDATVSNYDYQAWDVSNTSFGGTRQIGQTSWQIGQIGNETVATSYVIELSSPFEATKTIYFTNNTEFQATIGPRFGGSGGAHTLTNSYNGFTIFSSSNITAEVSIYGYRK